MTATSLLVLILAAAVFLTLAFYNSQKRPRRNTAGQAPDNGFLYAPIGTGDSVGSTDCSPADAGCHDGGGGSDGGGGGGGGD